MPGISGFARYGNAWLDADVNEKNRIMQLLKDAIGITTGATAIQGQRQDIRLAGASELRKQALFPTDLRSAEAVTGQQESQLSTMQRVESGEVESEARQRELFGTLTRILEEAVRGKQFQEASQILDVRNKLQMPARIARADFAEVGQREAQARLGGQQAQELLRQGQPGVAAGAAVAGARAEGAEAGVRTATAGERIRQGQPAAQVEAEVRGAEALTMKAILDRELSAEKLNSDYVDIITEAETLFPQLRNDNLFQQSKLYQAQAAKALTPGGGDRAPTELEWLRSMLSAQEFEQLLVQKHEVNAGFYDTAPKYMAKIQQALTDQAKLAAAMRSGQDVNSVLAGIFASNPTFQAYAGTSGADDKTDPNVILRELNRYIGVQKILLKQKWGMDYQNLTQMGLGTSTYTPGDLEEVIPFIEQNQMQATPVGEMFRLYKPLQGRKAALDALTNLMNTPGLHPMFWEEAWERFGEPNPEFPEMQTMRDVLGEQDYQSARSIIRAVQHRLLEGIPPSVNVQRQLEQPAGVTQ